MNRAQSKAPSDDKRHMHMPPGRRLHTPMPMRESGRRLSSSGRALDLGVLQAQAELLISSCAHVSHGIRSSRSAFSTVGPHQMRKPGGAVR